MHERLTALDGSFLRVETPNAHMHVAWAGSYRPTPGRPRPTIERLRRSIAGRLARVPRFRQRLAFAPGGLGEPFWVDDSDFDIRAHVTALTEPSEAVTRSSFDTLCSALLSEPLDRRRPLWHIYLVPRLEDGDVGLVAKLHHSMVDGLSVVGLATILFDDTPDAVVPEPDEWVPRPPPSRLRLLAESALQTARGSLQIAEGLARRASAPGEAAADLMATLVRVSVTLREDLLRAAPRSPLNVPIGPERVLVKHHEPLDALLRAKRHGVKLNDVCLAAVAGALRRLAHERGDEPRRLKTMVPVSLRSPSEAADLGNRISFVCVDLPLHRETPAARLGDVVEQTRMFKDAHRPEGGNAVMSALGVLPGPLKTQVARLAGSPRTYNLTVSNIPGPRAPVYLLGAELVEAYPVVPVPEDHALSVGIFTYCDDAFFGLYADPEALPDVERLPQLLHEEIAALTPPRRRAQRAEREPVLA